MNRDLGQERDQQSRFFRTSAKRMRGRRRPHAVARQRNDRTIIPLISVSVDAHVADRPAAKIIRTTTERDKFRGFEEFWTFRVSLRAGIATSLPGGVSFRKITTRPEKCQSMDSLCKIKWRDYGRLIISATSAHIPLRDPEVRLGRCARCAQLVVTGETVSRCHCRILAVNDAVYIEDLNSRNGTWVNGTRVHRALLVNGAVLHLGLEQFVFEEGPRKRF